MTLPSKVQLHLKTPRTQVLLVLLLALLLRLGQVLIVDPWPRIAGGDYAWYGSVGHTLVATGSTHGPVQTAPLFLLLAGWAEQIAQDPVADHHPAWLLRAGLFGDALFPNAVGDGRQIVRLLHVLLSTLTVWLVYRLGRTGWSHRVGLLAAGVLAVNPAFIIEAGNLTSETLTLFLLLWVLARWSEGVATPTARLMASLGLLLGLAALTRAVFLAFPLLLVLHLGIRHGWRTMLRQGAILLLALVITLAPWTVYNLVQWDRFVVAGEGLLGTLFRGAVGAQSAGAVDAALEFEAVPSLEGDSAERQEAFLEGLRRLVLDDLPGYASGRLKQLGGALLQPHNTPYYPGESIRDLAARWLREDRSIGGLLALTATENFWPKLLLYLFHFAALILGAVGLWRARRRWRDLWPLYALLVYVLGVHLALEAIPRYLFPAEPVWWLFAAALLVGTTGHGPAMLQAASNTHEPSHT